jgi:hypothetical protein
MITQPDSFTITLAQAIALHKVYSRSPVYETKEHAAANLAMPFDEWCKAMVSPGFGCIMVEWAGMFLGIEPDGYTHS